MYYTFDEDEKTFMWFVVGCWLLAEVVLVIVVVLTFDFGVDVDKVTIWGCFGGAVDVDTTDTVEEAKLLVAVVGTSLMYWT